MSLSFIRLKITIIAKYVCTYCRFDSLCCTYAIVINISKMDDQYHYIWINHMLQKL